MVDQPKLGIRQLSNLHELGAQLVYLTEKTKKKTYLQEEDMPVAFSHVALPSQSLEHQEKKGGFARLPAA